MNKYEDAVRDYKQFIKEVKKVRRQMRDLDDLYDLYKEINEIQNKIEDIDAGLLTEENKALLLDDLRTKSIEYEMLDVPNIEWPVMGGDYYKCFESMGIEPPNIDIFLILTEKHDLPVPPPV